MPVLDDGDQRVRTAANAPGSSKPDGAVDALLPFDDGAPRSRSGVIGLREHLPRWTAATAAVDWLEGQSGCARLLSETVYRTRYLVNGYPLLYFPEAWIRYGSRPEYLVRTDTELVVEGFGRAGSTFVVLAFLSAQPRYVRTAHNTHAAAQVIKAAKLGLPTLVVVRDPIESALSHMARRRISPRPALSAWIRYHERIQPYAQDIVLAPFEEATRSLGTAIRRVNERYDTDFAEFQQTPEGERAVFEEIERRNELRFRGAPDAVRARALARPTPQREARKRALRRALLSPGLAPLRAHAEELYLELFSSAPVHVRSKSPGSGAL